jgi:hypothetical protein
MRYVVLLEAGLMGKYITSSAKERIKAYSPVTGELLTDRTILGLWGTNCRT